MHVFRCSPKEVGPVHKLKPGQQALATKILMHHVTIQASPNSCAGIYFDNHIVAPLLSVKNVGNIEEVGICFFSGNRNHEFGYVSGRHQQHKLAHILVESHPKSIFPKFYDDINPLVSGEPIFALAAQQDTWLLYKASLIKIPCADQRLLDNLCPVGFPSYSGWFTDGGELVGMSIGTDPGGEYEYLAPADTLEEFVNDVNAANVLH